ncbi:MAG: hypothetical protein Q9220_000328 [cf. Caloplaca sp. 1 TL-2023]
MEVASGIIAAISLSVQVAETVGRLNAFLKRAKQASNGLKSLTERLDQFRINLHQVTAFLDQQRQIDSLPDSTKAIEIALRSCEVSVGKLDHRVREIQTSFARQGRLRKVWASLKTAVREEEMAEFHRQIHGNIIGLHTAMLANMSHLQHLTIKVTHSIAYWGIFGHIQTRRKNISLGISSRNLEDVISQETTVTLVPSLIHQGFEFRYCKSSGQLSRSLSCFPILSSSAEVFSWCSEGNTGRFKNALSHGLVSPFARDKQGNTLLHYASQYCRIEFCSLLIHLGVDADHIADNGKKAMHEPWGYIGQQHTLTDTLRVLTTAQGDVTSDDISLFFKQFYGPVEAADFLLSTHAAPQNIDSEGEMERPPLSLALQEYVRGRREWSPFIRKLLRLGADIHAERSDLVRLEGEARTLLDELFTSRDDPFDEINFAQEWLSMLAEAGYDTKVYLEHERRIRDRHNERRSKAYLNFYKPGEPRQLFFKIDDDRPSVSWDWWIDPSAAASLVCTEFLHMNLHHRMPRTADPCEHTYPFVYPLWSDACKPWIGCSEPSAQIMWREKARLARNRLDRRARKIYPDHCTCTRKSSSIPGAWIDEDLLLSIL